jgi:hypothetical protein
MDAASKQTITAGACVSPGRHIGTVDNAAYLDDAVDRLAVVAADV